MDIIVSDNKVPVLTILLESFVRVFSKAEPKLELLEEPKSLLFYFPNVFAIKETTDNETAEIQKFSDTIAELSTGLD